VADLADVTALKNWLRKNLGLYSHKIPNAHLLIYIDYIKTMVMNEDNIDKGYWLDLIKDLESKVRTFKRVEEKNEL
jgi:hypothetical protein